MSKTQLKFFKTFEEQEKFYNELKDCNFKMVSPFLPQNPEGYQWGVQWSCNDE